MATVCSSTPTATTTTLIPTSFQTVITTDSSSTLPSLAISTVISTTTCFGGADDDCIDTFMTTTTTIPGAVFVTQVPMTLAVDGFITETTTLFGQTCSVVPSGSSRPNVPRVTPTPSQTTSSHRPSQTSDLPQSTDNTEKSFPIGPVVGGAVGGLVVIGLVGFLLWKYFHKPTPPNFEVRPDKYDAYGREEQFYSSNVAPQAQQPPPGQQSTQTTNQHQHQHQHQQQNQQQQQQIDETGVNNGEDSQWDRPDRLPGRMEQKLAQKIDDAFGGRRRSDENSNAQSSNPPYLPQAQNPNYGQAYHPVQAPSPSTTAYSHPNASTWGRPTSNQYNVAAPGVPYPQVSPSAQNLQSQYSGYAEPAQ
ncbi:hypothetical protein CVT24_002425 [Panaeolus cyanescens]|uniref:Uncharacterized protein n=1 Tax=Panaeolus cyanescens TaxID=181874 RepID=A0A409W0R9_9AGAR|nr:hypothetical protein CVT24_002425 [Panaeolus cyanescens]